MLRYPYMQLSSPVRWEPVYKMYAVYRQAHTPTAVEFSVYCNFISSKEKNLVVAGTSQLFVYRIIHDVEVPFGMHYGRLAVTFNPLNGCVFLFLGCFRAHRKRRSLQVCVDNLSCAYFPDAEVYNFPSPISLQIQKHVRRSWSRWQLSLSLVMWCPWRACNSSEPTEMPYFLVLKMQRYCLGCLTMTLCFTCFICLQKLKFEWESETLCFAPQLSVVEYDPGTHDLKTLSLHYFEEPELRVCSGY